MHFYDLFEDKYFHELFKRLKNIGIEPDRFLAGEYFIRLFLHHFDPITHFPDENFPIDSSQDDIVKYWSQFNEFHKQNGIKWGCHPLAKDDIHYNLEKIKEMTKDITNQLPRSSLFAEVNALQMHINHHVDAINTILEKVTNVIHRSTPKIWKDKVTVYLWTSKLMYNEIFNELKGSNELGINQLIVLKARAYFQTSDVNPRDYANLRKDRIYFPNFENNFYKFLTDHEVRYKVNSFRKPKGLRSFFY